MSSAAELYRSVSHSDDPYNIAVLLSEKSHRSELSCLLYRHLASVYLYSAEDVAVYKMLYLVYLLPGHGGEVRKVKS